MAVGLRVGDHEWALGSPDFVFAFFSTVTRNLEPGGWGTRFPVTMGPFYAGEVAAERVGALRAELRAIRAELSALPPERVVWSAEDPSARPPWGDDIAPDIDDLGHYFVTADGEDLLDVLDGALAEAERRAAGVTLG